MGGLAKEILSVNIEEELKQSYLDYAMSVIVGRALPDVRDGLKPVHRRVLFAMNVLGNDWNKAYKKSARVVGDVIGKYHPHGDSAVYETIVRMAQPFAMRYTLVDGQGNFGSVDGDSAAAMRYTEIRMDKFAHELLADLDKETVDYVPNYDGTEQIPEVLPTKIPNLLVNGSAGIAVGMATNIAPHNLTEVINACLALIKDSTIDIDGLMEYIPAPDFPTGGFIYGRSGIVDAYRTGRGRVYIRAKSHVETNDRSGRETLVITEIPYQVNKAKLIEKIADLVKEKKIEGIAELRDESDKDGMRIAIEIKRGDMAEVVLNNLYAQTPMESVFGINAVALVDGQPRTLNLKDFLEAFIRHRREVVTRRTLFELRKARARGHVLEGLAIALSNIDPVIELIKSSPGTAEAKERLMARGWEMGDVSGMLERAGADACRPEDLEEGLGVRDGRYYLSMTQAQAILDLRLQKLTGLEHEKLINEYKQIIEDIGELLRILGSEARLMEVIEGELISIRDEFGDERRTEIVENREDFSMEDLINEEDMVVTISHSGYAKTQPLTAYQAQRRGGRGKSALGVKDEDFVDMLLVASTHDTLLCFTDLGRVFWLKVYQIPPAGRQSRGRPLVNLLSLGENERVTSILPVREFTADHFVFMATSAGTVKKTSLEAFARRRSSGLIALALDEGDHLVQAAVTHGDNDIMLFSQFGKAVRFHESSVREMGRTARGVRGIKLADGDKLISLILPDNELTVLTVSEKGYGKRTQTAEFPAKSRATQGVIAMVVNDRNGPLVAARQMGDGEEVMLISDQGTLVRTRGDEISVLSRNTQGVRIIRLSDEEKLVGVDCIAEPEEVEGAEMLDADGNIIQVEDNDVASDTEEPNED
ncbi:DNA gyrase subunit A [Salinispirillum marinum]|uniref:DNA gyrase subunit A n=2 Tax=Saccharospirillaceae TaxID=255527 RepID=A0ABV8BGI0_9GAMM